MERKQVKFLNSISRTGEMAQGIKSLLWTCEGKNSEPQNSHKNVCGYGHLLEVLVKDVGNGKAPELGQTHPAGS